VIHYHCDHKPKPHQLEAQNQVSTRSFMLDDSSLLSDYVCIYLIVDDVLINKPVTILEVDNVSVLKLSHYLLGRDDDKSVKCYHQINLCERRPVKIDFGE